jgi:hypothetical protein
MPVRLAVNYDAPINATSAGDNFVIPASPDVAIYATKYTYKVGGAVTITWKDTGGTVLCGPLRFASRGDGIIDPRDDDGHFSTAVGAGLVMHLDADVDVGGYMSY